MDSFIHSFVHSLNLSEKAYFKKFSSFHHGNKDKNYLKLYDLLMEQAEFSPRDLLPSLETEGLASHYSSEQNYLYRQLMTSLINFHFENSTYRKLTKQILTIDLLMEKGFRKKANKVLRKAKKMALELEEFSILLKLIQSEEEILFREGILNFTKKLQELKQERKRIMRIMENYSDLRLLREQVRELQYTVRYVSDFAQYQDLLNDPILEHIDNALSVKAKFHWYYVKMSVSGMRGNTEDSLKAEFKTLELIDQYPALVPRIQYAVTLSNILFDAAVLNDRPLFDKMILKLKSENEVDKNYLLYVEYVRKAKFGIDNNDMVLLQDVIHPANHFICSCHHLIETAQRNNLFLILVKSWVLIHDYTKAIELLNTWRQIADKKMFLSFRRMLRLIIYYELNWYSLLESEILSAYKILKKHGIYNKREQVLLAFFRVVIRKPSRKRKARKLLCEKLMIIEANPDYKLFYSNFDYLWWAQGG